MTPHAHVEYTIITLWRGGGKAAVSLKITVERARRDGGIETEGGLDEISLQMGMEGRILSAENKVKA